MNKHTPGPWVAREKYNDVFAGLSGHDGRTVCRMHTNDPLFSVEEIQSNARLVAAAPDLLEAAQLALNDLYWNRTAHDHALDKLRAAIRKATGER